MLVMGLNAFAALPPIEEIRQNQDIETISAWTAELNARFPGLNVQVRADMGRATERNAVIRDLKMLEGNLEGRVDVPEGSLTTVNCTHPTCGD